MFRTRMAVLALAGLSAAACGDSTSPPPAELVGEWAAPIEALQPSGRLERTLILGGDGRFVYDVRSFGSRDVPSPDDVSSYSRTEGRYEVSGWRLVMRPTALETWDAFYGQQSAPRREEPYRYDLFFSDARYTLVGDVLVIDYRDIGPADGIADYRLVLERR